MLSQTGFFIFCPRCNLCIVIFGHFSFISVKIQVVVVAVTFMIRINIHIIVICSSNIVLFCTLNA